MKERRRVVVLGALAFGYLTLKLGYKPYLERAQIAADQSELSSSSEQQQQHEQVQVQVSNPTQAQPPISKWAGEENG